MYIRNQPLTCGLATMFVIFCFVVSNAFGQELASGASTPRNQAAATWQALHEAVAAPNPHLHRRIVKCANFKECHFTSKVRAPGPSPSETLNRNVASLSRQNEIGMFRSSEPSESNLRTLSIDRNMATVDFGWPFYGSEFDSGPLTNTASSPAAALVAFPQT